MSFQRKGDEIKSRCRQSEVLVPCICWSSSALMAKPQRAADEGRWGLTSQITVAGAWVAATTAVCAASIADMVEARQSAVAGIFASPLRTKYAKRSDNVVFTWRKR